MHTSFRFECLKKIELNMFIVKIPLTPLSALQLPLSPGAKANPIVVVPRRPPDADPPGVRAPPPCLGSDPRLSWSETHPPACNCLRAYENNQNINNSIFITLDTMNDSMNGTIIVSTLILPNRIDSFVQFYLIDSTPKCVFIAHRGNFPTRSKVVPANSDIILH